jgi:hypothetical protein
MRPATSNPCTINTVPVPGVRKTPNLEVSPTTTVKYLYQCSAFTLLLRTSVAI